MTRSPERWVVLAGQWVCPHCHSGPFEGDQFTCGHCGAPKNG